ncbi:MAG TPA: hypothetical protein VH592_03905, partial [Gemmataceae bacterium]
GSMDDRSLRCAPCAARTIQFASAGWMRLVLEKVPLLILAAASSAVTMHAQVVAMKPSEHLAFGFRLANAVVSCATYLRKTVWPVDLAAFYRHLGTRLPMTPVIVSAAVLIFLSLVALVGYRRRPAVLVGWLWYLGTLVPVIGIVQVGGQSMADRYTYIPLIGIFLALAWCIPAPPIGRPAIGAAVCGVLVFCGVLTFRQTQVWSGSEELWSSSVKADDNPVSRCYYAGALYGKAGDFYDEAEELSRKGRTSEVDHRIAEAKARMAEAERQCRIASRMDPPFAIAYVQLGEYQIYRSDLEAALATFKEGVARDPKSSGLHDRLGRVLAYMGRIEEGCEEFREACRLVSASAARFFDLGTALALLGDYEGAQREWETGRPQEPDFSEQMRKYAESFLGRVDARRHCPAAAVFHAQEACWSSPTPQAELYQTLAEAYAAAGQPIAASLAAERALALAQTQGRNELTPTLRQLMHSQEPLARQKAARTAALALAAPTLGTLPGAIGALSALEADQGERRIPGTPAADGIAR